MHDSQSYREDGGLILCAWISIVDAAQDAPEWVWTANSHDRQHLGLMRR